MVRKKKYVYLLTHSYITITSGTNNFCSHPFRNHEKQDEKSTDDTKHQLNMLCLVEAVYAYGITHGFFFHMLEPENVTSFVNGRQVDT